MYSFWVWLPKTGREFWSVNIFGLNCAVEPSGVDWLSARSKKRKRTSRIVNNPNYPYNINLPTKPQIKQFIKGN